MHVYKVAIAKMPGDMAHITLHCVTLSFHENSRSDNCLIGWTCPTL